MRINGKRVPVWAPLYSEPHAPKIYGLGLQWHNFKRDIERDMPEVKTWTLQQFIDRTLSALCLSVPVQSPAARP